MVLREANYIQFLPERESALLTFISMGPQKVLAQQKEDIAMLHIACDLSSISI